MLPAQQGLNANNAKALHLHLRLVFQKQLPGVEYGMECTFEQIALAVFEVHLAGIKLAEIAAIFFGAIHRGVGMLN